MEKSSSQDEIIGANYILYVRTNESLLNLFTVASPSAIVLDITSSI